MRTGKILWAFWALGVLALSCYGFFALRREPPFDPKKNRLVSLVPIRIEMETLTKAERSIVGVPTGKVLMKSSGSAFLGVDLREAEYLYHEERRAMTVILPQPTVRLERLDPGKERILSEKRPILMSEENSAKLREEARKNAQSNVRTFALNSQEEAKDMAVRQVQCFFKQLNPKMKVDVKWK